MESALEERQETDSVPLVDDIRFHIASDVQTYSAIAEANQKLAALEQELSQVKRAQQAQPQGPARSSAPNTPTGSVQSDEAPRDGLRCDGIESGVPSALDGTPRSPAALPPSAGARRGLAGK